MCPKRKVEIDDEGLHRSGFRRSSFQPGATAGGQKLPVVNVGFRQTDMGARTVGKNYYLTISTAR
jgi:hypothetical protein